MRMATKKAKSLKKSKKIQNTKPLMKFIGKV